MKLSPASSCAVQALVLLASRKASQPVPSVELARGTGLRQQFLRKLLTLLVRARLLLSLKGPHGGYRLARPAKDITLLDVVEAIDGPVRGRAPQAVTPGDRGLDRRLQVVCVWVAEIVRRSLGRVSMAELARKAR
jgi:Rrf2 family protein